MCRHQHAKRAKFAERKADGKAGQARDGIPCLDPDKEHAVGDNGIRIKHPDLVAVCINLDDPADQRAFDLAAKDIARDGHTKGFNSDDRVIPRDQRAHVDLDTSDGAFELQAGIALQTRDGRRQGQNELLRGSLNVSPLHANLGDPDRQPCWPLERGTRGRPDADKHAKSTLGNERPIT